MISFYNSDISIHKNMKNGNSEYTGEIKMKIENIEISAEYKGINPEEKEAHYIFNVKFKNVGPAYSYTYLASERETDLDKNSKIYLTEFGMENALLCYASDLLYGSNNKKTYSLDMTRQDWEWIEDVLIRKHMKTFKKLYTNV